MGSPGLTRNFTPRDRRHWSARARQAFVNEILTIAGSEPEFAKKHGRLNDTSIVS
jgi:hypothetical protein